MRRLIDAPLASLIVSVVQAAFPLPPAQSFNWTSVRRLHTISFPEKLIYSGFQLPSSTNLMRTPCYGGPFQCAKLTVCRHTVSSVRKTHNLNLHFCLVLGAASIF